jgi:ABC-type transporter Mla MlaB component
VAGVAERVWVVRPGIDRAGIEAVCEHFASFAASLAPGEPTIICDVGEITHPDLVTLSLLARLQLTARRLGRGIQLHRAHDRLIELIVLSGLAAVLSLRCESAGEPQWQAEQGEEPVHVEEVVERLDPPG